MSVYDSRPETWEHIEAVRGWLHRCACEILQRGRVHDASKLREPERAMFDRFTSALRESEYGSPEYERTRDAMGDALLHHYRNNSHHPEHHYAGISEMTLLDLIEMLCDWKAAGERHDDGGDLMRSIEINQERFGYGDELKSILRASAFELGSLGA